MGKLEDFWDKDPSHEDVRSAYIHPTCRRLEGNFNKVFSHLQSETLVIKEDKGEILGLKGKRETLKDISPTVLKELMKRSWRTRAFPNIQTETVGRLYQGYIEGIDEWIDGYPKFHEGIALFKNPDREVGVEENYGFRNGITIVGEGDFTLVLACAINEGGFMVARRPVKLPFQYEFRDPLMNVFSQFKIENIQPIVRW